MEMIFEMDIKRRNCNLFFVSIKKLYSFYRRLILSNSYIFLNHNFNHNIVEIIKLLIVQIL